MNYPDDEERYRSLAQDGGVIRSKILPRRLPAGTLIRPSLIERLEAGKAFKLTLLSAPAGYGKTTMLTAWLGTSTARRFAWVSLDARDSDPVRLWTHAILALHGVEPRAGTDSLAALRANPDQIEDRVLPVLLEELSDAGPDLVLVLDDYHLAETVTLDSMVGAFLRYRPERVQFVISTRSDPSLGIARLRSAGDLHEIRAEHLRFDSSEVGQFLAALGIVGVSDDEASRLTESTGGWPAPLRLVALLVRDEKPSAFVDAFAAGTKPVVEYLTTDVLELLAPDVQDFVLKTSILGRMSGALCDVVVGRSGSGKLLADLERSSLFVSVDVGGVWYSQHHLFSEAMRLELSRTQQELVLTLHLRAAQWFEQQGDLESATEHAIASRDVTLASRLVATQVEAMAARGRWATVRSWLKELSWPAALADPELAWVRATSDSFSHDLDGAEQWLLTARKGAHDATGSLSLPLGFRVEMLSALVGVNDVDRAEDAARRALELAPGPMWEGAALVGLGQAQYLRSALAEARTTLRRAVALIPDAHPNLLVLAIGNLALADYADGHGADASPLLDRALETMASQPQSVPTAVLHMAVGDRARAGGDLRGAVGWYDSAIRILGEHKRSALLANAHLLSAAAFRALGDRSAELHSLDAADAILSSLVNPGDLQRRSFDLRHRATSESRNKTEFGDSLSERESAVLELAAAGLTQREIADQLFISYNTVKSHMKSSYRKLGASSRTDALARLVDVRAGADSSRRPQTNGRPTV